MAESKGKGGKKTESEKGKKNRIETIHKSRSSLDIFYNNKSEWCNANRALSEFSLERFSINALFEICVTSPMFQSAFIYRHFCKREGVIVNIWERKKKRNWKGRGRKFSTGKESKNLKIGK